MTPANLSEMVDSSWADILAQLPPDLDELATAHGVLKYHRAFDGVGSLLRAAFAYAIQDMSLRNVAAWGPTAGVCKEISDVALMKQLQSLPGFLTALVQRLLVPRADPSLLPPGLTLVDATSISRGGNEGNYWRINLSYSGAAGRSIAIELTDSSVGESIDAKRIRAGDVMVADRYYSKKDVFASIIEGKAAFLIRAMRTLKVLTLEGKCKKIQEFLPEKGISPGQVVEHHVRLRQNGGTTAARLILVRKTDEATARAVRQLQLSKTKKGRKNTDTPEALLAAQYVCLLTTVPTSQATAEALANAYRYRWQIELCFKRWKSILHFDNLRARGELAQTYILTKLVAALLIEETLHQASFSPWGAGSVSAPRRTPGSGGATGTFRGRAGTVSTSRSTPTSETKAKRKQAATPPS